MFGIGRRTGPGIRLLLLLSEATWLACDPRVDTQTNVVPQATQWIMRSLPSTAALTARGFTLRLEAESLAYVTLLRLSRPSR